MKKKFILLLAVISSLIFAEQVNAATIDVCKSGCTYSSIKTAYENSNAGDTIRIKEGTYEEDTIIIDKKINIIGETRTGIIIKQKTENEIFDISGTKDTITINNLVIDAVTKGEYKRAIYINKSEDIVLTNITIKDSNSGIEIYEGNNIRIHNLIATNITENAIYAEKSKVEITGGIITNAGVVNEDGAGFSSISLNDETEGTISGITINDSKDGGIWVSNLSNVKIDNLIATNITKNAVYAEKSKVEITGGTITNTGWYSVSLTGETEGTISGITINDLKDGGIWVSNLSNVKIDNLIATNIIANAIYAEKSKVEITGGIITNAGVVNEDGTGFSSISLNDETEGTISDVIIKDAKYEAIGINNTSKSVLIKNVSITDSNSGLYIGNATVLADNLYVVNSNDYAIKTVENGKITLKNTNGFEYDVYEFSGYSVDDSCGNYIDDSDYTNNSDISLYSCVNELENNSDINPDVNEDIDNPKTGEFNIFIIVFIIILAIGVSIYYFKRIRKNSEFKI